ncbi:hypothetical protein BvCmsK50A_00115 [Escherichia coli]|nr:hypothetical protein BvCmsK50A_00115 [Escherichia coli]
MFTGQATHTFTFRAHHQRQASGHFALIECMIRLACRTDDPDILFLQHTHGARKVSHPNQWNAFCRAAGYFFRRSVELCGAIFRHNHRVNASSVRATQARAEVVRIGYTVEDQQERLIERSDQIRQIVFLILTSWLHAGDNALMHGTVAFLVEILAVCQLDNHALRLKGVNQR